MCCNKSFIKRIVPFFLTFAVGLFIASFFVTIAAPTLRLSSRGEGYERHEQYHQRLEFEKQQLEEENSRLKQQLAGRENSSDSSFEEDAVPMPPMPPMPPRLARR